jgi:hypothetical protein
MLPENPTYVIEPFHANCTSNGAAGRVGSWPLTNVLVSTMGASQSGPHGMMRLLQPSRTPPQRALSVWHDLNLLGGHAVELGDVPPARHSQPSKHTPLQLGRDSPNWLPYVPYGHNTGANEPAGQNAPNGQMLPDAVVMPAPQKNPAAAAHDPTPEQLRVVNPVVNPAKDGAHRGHSAEPSLSA